MQTLKIVWTKDSYECEECGLSWAYGANVYLDNELVEEFVPYAHCYEGTSWEPDEIYSAILRKFYKVIEESA